ncbi:MAG: hypothetical protein HC913_18240 [Microscillaceae bacterium]|nr:hypothetical protein [Microscillaceae bacterium]
MIYANVISFIGLLLAFGLYFLIAPQNSRSEFEKRALAPRPVFKWASLFSGHFLDSLDLYVADNFPGREQFVAWAFAIRQNRGWPSEQVAFYKQTVMLNPAQPPPAQTQAKPEKIRPKPQKNFRDSSAWPRKAASREF